MKHEYTSAGVQIDSVVWAQFKAVVARKGLKFKFALTEAIRLWLKAQSD